MLPPILSGNNFEDNSADYGNDFASYPVRIGLVGSNTNEEIHLKNVGSGILLDQDLKLAFIDYDNQVMNRENTHQILIVPKSLTARVGGTNAVVAKSGIATFDGFKAIAEPGSNNISFSVSSQLINQREINELFNNTISQPDLKVDFRF